jgi:hypothetical protein
MPGILPHAHAPFVAGLPQRPLYHLPLAADKASSPARRGRRSRAAGPPGATFAAAFAIET